MGLHDSTRVSEPGSDRDAEVTEISDTASLWLVFGLPPMAPFAATLLSWSCRRFGPWRWVAGIPFLGLVGYLGLLTTTLAYHVRNAYDDLPDISWAAQAGIVWAMVLTLPSVIGFALRYKSISSALVSGLVIAGLAAVFLIQGNLAFVLFLSFE